ncbi:SSI family serine proteinase inhibitor [Yinghuangia soli]|uniref:Subtilase-type protease inhibitor n=1 Tax=Yinghuangia soli TaxID=2908204 RepID=A0AA41PZL0_9ACTN|nr:SSI family serine proteinase inhibitor [Yinghuangia soli]MCF2527724.1 subtilase-type protease inhibitor [Yinghuangia soli]
MPHIQRTGLGRIRTVLSRRTAALAGAAALAFTALGGAAPATATPPPYGHMFLSVYEGVGTEGERIGYAELWCNPNTGTHPDPDAACAALEAADGNPGMVAGDPGPCTMEYRPVTAVAKGYWGGGVWTISYTGAHGNRCALHRATTPVFDIH